MTPYVCVTQRSVVNQSLTTDPELWTRVEEINLLDMEWNKAKEDMDNVW